MNKNLKNILLGLAVLILLPIIILINFQISSFNKNEELIKDAYHEQLDAILFSINQYSQDVVNDWKLNISSPLKSGELNNDIFKTLLQNNRAIKCIFILTENNKEFFLSNGKEKLFFSNYIENIKPQIIKSTSLLIKYKEQGYYRSEPIVRDKSEPLQALISLLPDSHNSKKILGIIFNSSEFVTNTLAPKIQEVVKDKFVLFVDNDTTNIYQSENIENRESSITKALWVVPTYTMGILLKGKTIDELMGQRIEYNYILLLVGFFVIIIAGIFVFRSINKEIKLAQLKSDFVSNVSHELKTPLALISMFSETLEMGRIKSEEKKQEYYSIIHSETNRLSKMVSSVLNFSKMEAGKREFKFAEYDFNLIIQQIIDTYSYHFSNKGFTCEYVNIKLPKIYCDKEAVSEAIINLIDNAIKYSQNEKRITIRVGLEQNSIFCEIEDYGIGISQEDQKKIFDKFFRATSGNIHDTKGTGLGLSIVKSIIDAHNGEISLTSKTSKGTIFKLSFPQNRKG